MDARAQLRDTLTEVQIKRKKNQSISQDARINDFSSGQKIITIDTVLLQQYKMQNAAQLLSQQVPVFIKSYGMNGLATLNFRGSSAAQSQVYWNGVPIQNAALGMADISLLPVSFTNRMQIIYGGSAALLGSGNVGGALLLETDAPDFDSVKQMRYEIGLGAGSYNQYQVAGKMNYISKKWFLAANIISQKAKNDFKYSRNGNETKNENAALKGISAMLQTAYRLNDKNTFRMIAWMQDYKREIPPALFESYSVKTRKDVSVKLFADWNRKTTNDHQYIRMSFITDKMHYEDSVTKLLTQNNTAQYYIESGWSHRIGNRHKLLLFLPLYLSEMNISTGSVHQLKTALAAAYNYRDLRDRLSVSVSARGERINDVDVFLPGISASYELLKWMKLRGNIQKTYRVPTLNELYFEPGGNKDLKPEKGWATDLGYIINLKPTARFTIQHDIAAYYRLINDWILWFGGAIWTPHNISQVRSTGIEANWTFNYSLSKVVFHIGLKGAYTRSVTTQTFISGDGSIGKQIPYTPEWMGLLNAGFTYNGIYFNWNYVYTGLRYFNTDETGLLPAYQLVNMQISKDFDVKYADLQTSLLLNNLFAENYTVVAGRPMPGRNFALSVTLRKK